MNSAATKPDDIVAHFGEADAPHDIDLSAHAVEDWICPAYFWPMAGPVCLPYLTRCVPNDSFAWTEEMAVYGLIAILFIGSAMGVRRPKHIQVGSAHRDRPPEAGHRLALAGFALLALRALHVTV